MVDRTSRKYLAFDIETAKESIPDFAQWRAHRPIGIVCAATCAEDGEPRTWFSTNKDGIPAKQMSQGDARQLVGHLRDMIAQGYTLLTWNGASFDFDILAEEADAFEDCSACVLDHVDMMFHLVCLTGRGVKLAKAAEGLGLPGKPDGMCGSDVPRLWATGAYEQVLAYARQDVRLALQIAAMCDRTKEFAWVSSTGLRKTLPLADGWKTVGEAFALPMPDTRQLATPGISREDCLAWTKRA